MFNYHIDFNSPWYLLLLLFIPALWYVSFRSLAGLGNIRRLIAIALRTAVLLLLVCAIADIHFGRTSDRLTVIYLLDQSLSIPEPQRKKMLDFVNAAIREHRDNLDRAGVIVFGREASIEIPPFDDDVQIGETIETLPDREYTNLASAMKLAQASFPEDAAKRIVIISDGNENLGSATEQARSMEDAGISIDVVPIRFGARAEVIVEKVTMPSDVRKGQPFDLRVVVNNTTVPTKDDDGLVRGQLVIMQKTDDQPEVLSREDIVLEPGKRVFSLRQQIDKPAFYTYEAQFVPNSKDDDAMPQNNRATAFSHVRGSGQVLLIEDQENKGEHAFLVERLRKENLEVTVRASDQLFTSLAELQPFDTVILANVPRSSGNDADTVSNFSDEQIKMLVRNTEVLGSGLVMLGGPNSFGAGGWTNTELEKAMPVDFQIKSAKIVPKGALAMIMHASELADGNGWQKRIGEEAIKALGSQDYCGLLHYGAGGDEWLWSAPKGFAVVGPNRDKMLAKLDRMTPGDMPDFDPAMKTALRGFQTLPDAAVRHMIIISDGDPTPPSGSVIKGLNTAKVTVSTVAVGTHGPAQSAVLRQVATDCGGKYYQVTNNNALPRIFQREARRVARPLVYEKDSGFVPQITYPHEMLSGIDNPLPPIKGFVMTSVKQNPLVEVAMLSPEPAGGENNVVLASWTYGLGRALVFTSDAGARWSTAWTNWENYDKFFSQMVRWSMRPTGDQGKFSVATDVADGKVRVIVTALDKDDEYLNLLNLGGMAVGPNMEPVELGMKQIAPGRYMGTFDAKDSGSYFVMLNPGAGQAPIQTGVNVPYSAEFLNRETNEPLLLTLASIKPKGATAPGKLIEDPNYDIKAMLKTNSFRHDLPKAVSNQEAWHYLAMLACMLFFCDVFVRRVTINLEWVPPLATKVWNRIRGRDGEPVKTEYMARLRSRKAEVTESIEQKKAATRFEPAPDAPVSTSAVADELAATGPARPKDPAAPKSGGLAAEKEEESYTDRLLKAKKKVWEDREKQ